MMRDVCHGYSGTSPTRRRSMRLSDWQGRFDGSTTGPTPIPLTTSLLLYLRHVSILLGSYIPGQGIGHITLGGQWYGSTFLRGVNLGIFQAGSLSPAQNTKDQVLIPTSDIFSVSIVLFLMIFALWSCSRSTQNTRPRMYNGSRMCYCTFLGEHSPQ